MMNSMSANGNKLSGNNKWYNTPIAVDFIHYINVCILGLLTWGLLWCALGENWALRGDWFLLAAVAAVAWACGLVLHAVTTLPPLLAALVVGIIARNVGILDMREFTDIDMFLRKVYPVVILGKASLGWNLTFMKNNWQQVAALGAVPWAVDMTIAAVCAHFLLDFPWIWGFLLGSIYASVTPAIVMPSVMKIAARAGPRMWGQLVMTSGGIDMILSVGVFGLIFSYMFVDTTDVIRYVKASLSLVVGVGLGVAWGLLAGALPQSKDLYVVEIRVLFILIGGLFANFLLMDLGWGGVGGVAVLVCNAVAAKYWAQDGWMMNKNPAATAYRVTWSALEPMLYAYTGTFFEFNRATGQTLLYGLAILTICLVARLTATALVCRNMTLKERLFMCCTWIPKSIVEAVLCPMAINAILMNNSREDEMNYAEDIMRLIIQLIIITTPLGYLLTEFLGPRLLIKPNNEVAVRSDPSTNVTFNNESRTAL